ncbi:hypothetical protein [Candidatus Aalborgicola defluviihabitans]|uniref:hypothetical protein n=1 Tax=Candidatus Aalborgicola defluviihabitans TaxID=3386187 RepID=UPI001EBAC4B5|nr:hypothetical protein [Burkholderiales bacterium]
MASELADAGFDERPARYFQPDFISMVNERYCWCRSAAFDDPVMKSCWPFWLTQHLKHQSMPCLATIRAARGGHLGRGFIDR